MKKAFVTGISGQDGALLASLLLENGYQVLGGIRRSSDLWRLATLGIENKVELFALDYLDMESVHSFLLEKKPDEIYNLAAQSSVAKSFFHPLETAKADAFSVLYLLEAIRLASPESKFFQAGSCEMFGNSEKFPQEETTAFVPINPYSSSKVYAHNLTVNYRQAYGLHTTNGILFNHESELRGKDFFTRRVSMHVARYSKGEKIVLDVGNIHAVRDIGYANEYAMAIYLSMQSEKPSDYIIATGKCCKIKDFIEACFFSIDVKLDWEGEGIEEKAFDAKTGQLLIRVNPANFRPTDILKQQGNSNRIRTETGWEAKLPLSLIAEKMVKNDIDLIGFT